MGRIASKRAKGMKFMLDLPYTESALMQLGYELYLKRNGNNIKYSYRKQIRIMTSPIVVIDLPKECGYFFEDNDEVTVIHPTEEELKQIYHVMTGGEYVPSPQIEKLIKSLLWK